jgi:hypothetical protein
VFWHNTKNKIGYCQKFYEKMEFIQKKKKREILSWLELELRKGSAQTS